MEENNFKKSIDFVLKWEGYRSELASDPGGLTIWGISKRAHPNIVDKLKDMDKEQSRKEATQFYKETYWKRSGMKLNWPVNIVIFNAAVQFGTKSAASLLQKTYNKIFSGDLKVDGIVGEKTAASINSLNKDKLILLAFALLLEQLDWYNNSDGWKVFGLGWTNRLIDLYQTIIS